MYMVKKIASFLGNLHIDKAENAENIAILCRKRKDSLFSGKRGPEFGAKCSVKKNGEALS